MSAEETKEFEINFGSYRVKRLIVLSVQWQNIPWWKRLGAAVALPYQIIRFVVVGKGDFIMVKNVDVHGR